MILFLCWAYVGEALWLAKYATVDQLLPWQHLGSKQQAKKSPQYVRGGLGEGGDQFLKAAPVWITLAEPSNWLIKRLQRVILAGPTNTTS